MILPELNLNAPTLIDETVTSTLERIKDTFSTSKSSSLME